MQEYVERLMRCGYSPDRAYCICQDFMKNLPLFDLQLFVESIERDSYVDRIQQESDRT